MTRSKVKDLLGDVDDPVLCSLNPMLHMGPDLFDVESNEARHVRESAAKAVCADCPARRGCLEYALAELPSHGVWGGHTVGELVRLSESARTRSLTDAT